MPKRKEEARNPLMEAITEIKENNPEVGVGKKEIVDIMTFCSDPNYLDLPNNNFNLWISQKTILKAFYMGTKGNENLTLSQEEWGWLYENEGDLEIDGLKYEKNIKDVIRKLLALEKSKDGSVHCFRELHLVLGRRGSKCHEENQLIPTTIGSISFRELCDRYNNGETIGICTYDPNTLKRSITYNIKLEDNGVVDCFKIKTERGFEEMASYNHPYLIWRDDWEKPKFVDLSKVKKGDRIAVADNTELFGEGGIGINRAALLGYFQGDGGITHSIIFTTQDDKILHDFKKMIYIEFGNKYNVKHVENYDYTVVKKTGRFKQDGNQKNEVKEWLKAEGCYGKKSKEKIIPQSVLRGSKKEISIFLNRLFACDGWASTEKVARKNHSIPKSSIGICLASEDFVVGIQNLLLKFGIHSVIRYINAKCNGKIFDAWRLEIVRKYDMINFEKEIGIYSKEHQVGASIKVVKTRGVTKSIFDSIPMGVWKYINKIIVEKKIINRQVVGNVVNERLRKQYTPNFKKVFAYGKNTDDEFLKNIGASDVKWDVVNSVVSVGPKNTIAMEVKDTNIIGTHFVSHNTVLASIISSYEAYKLLVIGDGNPHYFYGLPEDDEIAIINVALSQQQAGRLFYQVQSRIRNCPFFANRIAKGTTSEIRLYTDLDLAKQKKNPKLEVPGSILILCGHSNPDTLAGYNAILILFDELAFYDESGKVTGSYFYDRLKPSLAKFVPFGEGRLVEISSPNTTNGIFYDIYKHDSILSFQLPTWCTNPDITYEGLAEDRKRNPDRFAIEYGAQWAKGGIYGNYFDTGLVERCIRTDIGPISRPEPGVDYYLHIDPAKNGNRYVALLVGKYFYTNSRGQRRIRVRLANMWIWDPQMGIGLLFNEIDKEIINICGVFHPMAVTYDQYNSVHSLQLLRSHGINAMQTSYNRAFKNKIYQNLKDMMSYHPNPELEIYDDTRLILEMKALKYRPTARGISLVVDKHGDVATDDIIDCLAGATAMASESVHAALPLPVVVYTGWR
jgi:hypothetical protein